jgi:hypothetical protein
MYRESFSLSVAGHPPLHERAEGGLGSRLHDQVKVIGHEVDAEDLDGVLRFRGGEQVEECGVVAVLVEDRGAAFPTVQHMVGVSGYLSAWNPRHGKRTVREMGVGTQGKVACPIFFSPPSDPTTVPIGGGKFTKTTKTVPGRDPGQSRTDYVVIKNQNGDTIRTYHDSYDRAGNWVGPRKPLRGGPEGRPAN